MMRSLDILVVDDEPFNREVAEAFGITPPRITDLLLGLVMFAVAEIVASSRRPVMSTSSSGAASRRLSDGIRL